jgi:hypothetical protein
MIFVFKKRTVVLDCFTDNPTVHKLAPIDYARSFYPEWWKNTPNTLKANDSFIETGTIKRCRGLIDYYANGIIIPLWSDLSIVAGSLDKPGVWFEFADKNAQSSFHPVEQRNHWLPNERYNHMKLLSPWAFKTKNNINFAWTKPVWNYDTINEFELLPAVVNYKYQNGTDINIMMDYRENTREIHLKANQPMVNLLPMTDYKVKLKTHLVDRTEMNKVRSYPLVFNNNYAFKKSRIDAAENKCPFRLWKNIK